MESHSGKTIESNKLKPTQDNVNVPDSKEQIVKKSVPVNISNSASIIRIIPNNMTLPHNSSLRTFVVNCSSNLQSITSPSTSTSNATADHEYVYKEEAPLNIICFNESEAATENTVLEIVPTEIDLSKVNNLKREIEDEVSKIPEKISKVHSETCCDFCRNTLEMILQKQNEILRFLKNTPSVLNKEMKFDLLPFMPFDDLNDFLDFDESLSNENVLNQLIMKLQRLLVTIDKKSVSNILGSLLTNELCKKISWIGIKDTIAFQNTNMVNHIIDIIQDHHDIDVDSIKGYIAEWLRRCSDRIASEIRKNKKKAQQIGYDDK